MVTLIEDSITDEKLRSKPSQKLLIINRYPLGVFLNLEIPFDFMKPGLFHYFFGINLMTVRRFVHSLDGNLGSLVIPVKFKHGRHCSQSIS